jgi:hypothetical protein
MPPAKFDPGFRFSALDGLVLIVGAISSGVLWAMTWWWGFVVGFVLAHFFLFCNVVRLARPLELGWALVFVVFAGGTIVADLPGWPLTAIGSLVVTVVVVAVEVRKPSYHGVGWQRLNPGLPAWWESRMTDAAIPRQRFP